MLSAEQAAVIKARLARGDKQHDIAATFGVNGGRIAEIKTGAVHPGVKPAPIASIPSSDEPPRRWIDPNAPLSQQVKFLSDLIRNPPENSRVITITPDLAAWILTDLNTHNRSKRPAKIKRFSEAMERDGFLLTGDTIKFSRGGLLIDGQNRLSACVRYGKRFRSHVVFGIDDRAFTVIDANAVRNNPDTMKIAGVTHPQLAAQAIRWIIICGNDPLDRGRSIDNDELLKYYITRIDKDRFDIAKARAVAVPSAVPAGALAAHLYLFSAIHAKATERFARDLADNVRGARKLITKLANLRKQNLGRLHETQVNALIIQAWTAYRKGESLTSSMLNWTETKDYPTIG